MKGIFSKKKNEKNLLLRNQKGDEAETWHTCLEHYRLHIFCFYSGRIRTLVAMATYIFHRLIMGKVNMDNFFCLNGDIWNLFFTEMFIE